MTKNHQAKILCAVAAQALDEGLWFDAKHISEAYLQQALRLLHKVIEDNDQKALDTIIEMSE